MDTQGLTRNEFSRNIGLLSEQEQEKLLNARVAVAGAGGVGGIHILTLARLGVGKFHIADLDEFDTVNVSRQFGACQSTLGRHKAHVLAEMVKDINPAAEVEVFDEGVNESNVEIFLTGCQAYLDGIEFFEIDIRRLVFKKCREMGIYALTAAPLGFGATLQVFSPTGMAFDDYFGFEDAMGYEEKIAAFAAGLTPWPWHLDYLDRSKVNFGEKKGPAVAPACTLAASLIATETLKVLTGKASVRPVPCYLQMDMLRGKFRKGRIVGGAKNPIQKFKKKKILKWIQSDSTT